MKRFHVHIAVEDLAASLRFYSKLFAMQPSVVKDDYAKWMLEDPRVNFAISQRGGKTGLNHLGFQVDSAQELALMREQAERAELSAVDEAGASCCYARSDKHWIEDPSGIAWEAFHTLGEIPVFGEPAVQDSPAASVCCPPQAAATRPKCCG